MNRWPCVDFVKLTNEVKQPKCGPKDLTILGGRCAESNLKGLSLEWDLSEMPFRVWEYSSEIAFERNTPPKNIILLERGRIFGEGGDLILRRNGMDFSWRFIGPGGIEEPDGKYDTQNYWERNQDVMFHRDEKTTLLWGEWNGERWVENRVGAARLNYPVDGKRIQLHYKTFTHAGFVEFVWFTSLSEWEG